MILIIWKFIYLKSSENVLVIGDGEEGWLWDKFKSNLIVIFFVV